MIRNGRDLEAQAQSYPIDSHSGSELSASRRSAQRRSNGPARLLANHFRPAKRVPEPRQTTSLRQRQSIVDGSKAEAIARGWSDCAQAVRSYDKGLITGWQEEIDGLLVFAGLFSAVLTAFVVESYQQLAPPAIDKSPEILQQILQQLSGQPITPFPSPRPFKPASSALRINLVWFTSLVLSLSAALFGIMAKQWVREYLDIHASSARESVCLRQHRHNGLVKWRVSEIMASLPLLLQLAVMLFLVGLLDLLWTLNHIVAGIMTVVITIPLILAVGSAVIPIFSSTCPYKSPISLILVRSLAPLFISSRCWLRFLVVGIPRYIRRGRHQDKSPLLKSAIHFLWRYTKSTISRMPTTWSARDLVPVHQNKALAGEALLWTHKNILDCTILDAVTPCVADLDDGSRVQLAFDVVAEKSCCGIPEVLAYLRPHDVSDPLATDASLPELIAAPWEDNRNQDLTLLALPEVLYAPERDAREVERQLHMLLAALSASKTRSWQPQDGSISRVDILLLIEALLEEVRTVSVELGNQYCRNMLAVLSEPPLHIATKTLVARSLHRFTRSHRPKLACFDFCQLATRALEVFHSQPPELSPGSAWNHHHRELFTSTALTALHALTTTLDEEGSADIEYRTLRTRLLRAVEQFVRVGGAGGWSHWEWCEGLFELVSVRIGSPGAPSQEDRRSLGKLADTLLEVERMGRIRLLKREKECLHHLAFIVGLASISAIPDKGGSQNSTLSDE